MLTVVAPLIRVAPLDSALVHRTLLHCCTEDMLVAGEYSIQMFVRLESPGPLQLELT
ncbi:MAG: hypothetical protein HW383_116 [Candidatus Magasanikbacteria bacterium]|nr:hypothetical protein [Candidatus Magasanikbacteria bacterium]